MAQPSAPARRPRTRAVLVLDDDAAPPDRLPLRQGGLHLPLYRGERYTEAKLKAHGVQLNGIELLQTPFMPAQLLDRVKALTVRR